MDQKNSYSQVAPSKLPLELFQFKPKWGLPSSCPDCLAVHLLVNMLSLEFAKFRSCSYPYHPAAGKLPVLKINREFIQASKVFSTLRKSYPHLDSHLTASQCADVHAYENIIKHKLAPALLFCMWSDAENYNNVTTGVYAKDVPFPVNRYLRWNNRRAVLAELKVRGVTTWNIAKQMLRECYATFQKRIGTNVYFFGARPCSLDALIAAHLSVHFHIPLPRKAPRKYKKRIKHVSTKKEYGPDWDALDEKNRKLRTQRTTEKSEEEQDKRNDGTKVFIALAAASVIGIAVFNFSYKPQRINVFERPKTRSLD